MYLSPVQDCAWTPGPKYSRIRPVPPYVTINLTPHYTTLSLTRTVSLPVKCRIKSFGVAQPLRVPVRWTPNTILSLINGIKSRKKTCPQPEAPSVPMASQSWHRLHRHLRRQWQVNRDHQHWVYVNLYRDITDCLTMAILQPTSSQPIYHIH